jgi:hypothetical protein
MSAATMSANQIYEKKLDELRSRFTRQFGDAAEANDCLKKLKQRFDDYAEFGRRESDPGLKCVLMLMAGKVTTEKLTEKRQRREKSLLNLVRNQVAQTLKAGGEFWQPALRLVGSFRWLRLRQLPATSR